MKITKKVIILGTGGSSVDILDTMNDINRLAIDKPYECVGFLDDDDSMRGKLFHGIKILGPLSSASEFADCYFVNGIGGPTNFWKKEAIISKTGIPCERFETIIHPSSSVSKMAQLGYGIAIFQNVTVTANAKVGNHVIILPNTVISHEDLIGDYTCIAGGVCVSGRVKVGKACYLGACTAVTGDIEIGDYCLTGIGSVILKNISPNSVVVGNPAKFLRNTIINK